MRYTLLLHSNEEANAQISPEQWGEIKAVYGKYIQALTDAGVFVDTDWLQPSHASTTLSMVDGECVVQDGPFADTKEQLGGYFVIEVPDLDAAMAWAKTCPALYSGSVEIRPSAM